MAIFGGVIRMKLVTPFFHTEFDAEQFLFTHFGLIQPTGDFVIFGGYFLWRYLNEACDTSFP